MESNGFPKYSIPLSLNIILPFRHHDEIDITSKMGCSLLLLTCILWIAGVHGLILSKSSIQMCEDRGLSGHGDPKDITSGKQCAKKMVVLMTVKNNQVSVHFQEGLASENLFW